MLDLNDIIRRRVGRELPGCVLRRLERLLHIEDINDILLAGQGLQPQEFLRYVFQRLNVRYDMSQTARLYDDRYIFVANHPLVLGVSCVRNPSRRKNPRQKKDAEIFKTV